MRTYSKLFPKNKHIQALNFRDLKKKRDLKATDFRKKAYIGSFEKKWDHVKIKKMDLINTHFPNPKKRETL